MLDAPAPAVQSAISEGVPVSDIGPVEYAVIVFPGNRFNGDVAPALADLVQSGTIRIIDVAFVAKDDDGDIVAFEISDLHPDVQTALQQAGASEGGLLSDADMLEIAEGLDPSSSAMLVVWEDLWAARFAAAVRDSDGVVVSIDRIPREIVLAARDWAAENA